MIGALRLMHCGNLHDINGIQINMFASLQHLNLSSNNLSDISELACSHHVKELNLSCNKICSIKGLENMLHCLEKLTLSHNRIVNLNYFRAIFVNGQSAPNLSFVDLNDNYISELEQIAYFKPVISLKEIILAY